MKLWQLGNSDEKDPWKERYDCMFGFIVRAASEQEARELASTEAGAEGKKVWLNPKRTWCEEVEVEGNPEILIRDITYG